MRILDVASVKRLFLGLHVVRFDHSPLPLAASWSARLARLRAARAQLARSQFARLSCVASQLWRVSAGAFYVCECFLHDYRASSLRSRLLTQCKSKAARRFAAFSFGGIVSTNMRSFGWRCRRSLSSICSSHDRDFVSSLRRHPICRLAIVYSPTRRFRNICGAPTAREFSPSFGSWLVDFCSPHFSVRWRGGCLENIELRLRSKSTRYTSRPLRRLDRRSFAASICSLAACFSSMR